MAKYVVVPDEAMPETAGIDYSEFITSVDEIINSIQMYDALSDADINQLGEIVDGLFNDGYIGDELRTVFDRYSYLPGIKRDALGALCAHYVSMIADVPELYSDADYLQGLIDENERFIDITDANVDDFIKKIIRTRLELLRLGRAQ